MQILRTAYFGQQFLIDQGKIYGVNLGYDHCAEHEWGINHLEKDFAITAAPHVFGIERRKAIVFNCIFMSFFINFHRINFFSVLASY